MPLHPQNSTSLADRLDRGTAPGWKPEVGDSIVGTIVDIDERDSAYGEGTYPVLTIRRDDDGEEVAVHCFHSVLKSEIARKRPQVNDAIGIRYLGIPAGKKYEMYRVVWEKAMQLEYERMGAEAQAELSDVVPDADNEFERVRRRFADEQF